MNCHPGHIQAHIFSHFHLCKLLLAAAICMLLPNIALAEFLGLAEYEEIQSPVYLASLTLSKKPNNPQQIHAMTGKKQVRLHIQKAGYPLRSLFRHLDTWGSRGNDDKPHIHKSSKASIKNLEKLMKEAIDRPFVKRGDIILFDILNDNIRISINGKLLLEQKDKELTAYLLNIWVGYPPADQMLYKTLVTTSNKSKSYQALLIKLSLANPNFNEEELSFTTVEQTEQKAVNKVILETPKPEKTVINKPKAALTAQPIVKTKVKAQPKNIPQAKLTKKDVAVVKKPTITAPKPPTETPKEVIKEAPAIGTTYTHNTASHDALVIADKGYSNHIKNLLIKAIKASPLPIDINKMPEAALFISNQGMVYSGEFSITPQAEVKVTRKERMVLKSAAISISPVPVTQNMKNNEGLYVVKVRLAP